MKKVFEAVTEFKDARQKADAEYNETMRMVKKNYIKGSEKYNAIVSDLKKTHGERVAEMKLKGLERITQRFDAIRNQIASIDYAATSPEIDTVISRFGKMTDMEKEMLLNTYKGSYMDRKMLFAAANKPFDSVDDIIGKLNYLDGAVNGYFKNYDPNAYRCKNIEHGALLTEFDEKIINFVNQYSNLTE